MSGTQKSVTVKIDPDELDTVKGANYRLCIAKKVNDSFNVIWQSYDKYLENNSFSWTPKFQVFGRNSFQSGLKVVAETNTQDIQLGEKVKLDSAGHLHPSASQPDPEVLVLDNEYGEIHPGVNQLTHKLDGTTEIVPIYCAAEPIVKGEDKLKPKEEVMIWMEQNVETSTMFSDDKSKSIVLDLTSVDEASCLYKNGTWQKTS